MSNYCGVCGIKLEQQYKFCPNCGTETSSFNNQESLSASSNPNLEIYCEVCGENNSVADISCRACGAELKTSFSGQRKVKSENIGKKKLIKQKDKRKILKEKKLVAGNKELNNRKIILIFAGVLISLLLLLTFTGKFDSVPDGNTSLLNQTTTDSGIDLSNIDEINELEEKVKSNPDDKTSVIKLANLLQDSGMFERAIIYYKKYIELQPTDANVRVDLGICYYNLNDFQSAIKNMEDALKYQPDHQLAHLNLGIVNLSAGDLSKSREWLTKAVEIEPGSEAGKKAKELLQSH